MADEETTEVVAPEVQAGEAPQAVSANAVSATTPPATDLGTSQELARQLEWYKQQYMSALSELQQKEAELESYATQGLSEEEKAAYELEREQERIRQERQQLEMERYAQSLLDYYGQFVPRQAIRGSTPSEWQDSVLRYLHNQVQMLQQKASAPPRPGERAPKVSSGQTAGAPPRKTVFDYTPEELENLMTRLRMGDKVEWPPAE